MIEIIGDLWKFYGREGIYCCITTNGFVKSDGRAVMGRGCAKEAVDKFPQLPRIVGTHVSLNGNCVAVLCPDPDRKAPNIVTFPVKHVWWEKADIDLIKKSAMELSKLAKTYPSRKYILPRPGCGNGLLEWDTVKAVIQSILPNNVFVITKEGDSDVHSDHRSGQRPILDQLR